MLLGRHVHILEKQTKTLLHPVICTVSEVLGISEISAISERMNQPKGRAMALRVRNLSPDCLVLPSIFSLFLPCSPISSVIVS